MNKKGFTLIEMLVVIAIIAVLVSIIVPVVSNSTRKAAAATNAANLRSAAATIAIDIMSNKVTVAADGTVTGSISLNPVPDCKTNGGLPDGEFTWELSAGTVVTKFGNLTAEQYALIAETGEYNG